jgi:hypothetical protein
MDQTGLRQGTHEGMKDVLLRTLLLSFVAGVRGPQEGSVGDPLERERW